MSEIVTLFSQSPRTAGTVMTLPVVGRVTFDNKNNSIEVPEELVSELQSQEFGLTLLTEQQVTKSKEVVDKEKRKESIKETLSNENMQSLSDVFEELKEGRSQEEQDYLDLLISDLKTIGVHKKSKELKTGEEMLRALSQQELRELLDVYPKKETKTLNSLELVIAYLKKKMS